MMTAPIIAAMARFILSVRMIIKVTRVMIVAIIGIDIVSIILLSSYCFANWRGILDRYPHGRQYQPGYLLW